MAISYPRSSSVPPVCFSETMSQNLSQKDQKRHKYSNAMHTAIPWNKCFESAKRHGWEKSILKMIALIALECCSLH